MDFKHYFTLGIFTTPWNQTKSNILYQKLSIVSTKITKNEIQNITIGKYNKIQTANLFQCG